MSSSTRPEVMESGSEFQTISEQILEIRYLPDARVLDHRGNIATSVSDEMGLPKWRISENRVDVHTEDDLFRVFVSFRNSGVVIRNSTMPDYFPNHASKFMRRLVELEPFRDPMELQRLGVRLRSGVPTSLSFDELMQRYLERVVNPAPELISVMDAKLIDIGAPMNFETSMGTINTNGGPMRSKQLRSFFNLKEEDPAPDVALYIDLDYWIRPEESIPLREIVKLVKTYASENWDRHVGLVHLILE